MVDKSWPVRRIPLHPPSLEELAAAVHEGIQPNFITANTSVSLPPDLRQSPFHLAAPGLSGNPRVADVGGTANLRPLPRLEKRYDLLTIANLMDMSQEGGLLIGAGAGPFFDLGLNTELMPNFAYGSVAGNRVNNYTRYAKVLEGGNVLCEKVGTSTGFALMCNLLGSDGKTGPLLHIIARGRKGKLNFTEAIQKAIRDVYGDRLISLGGVFVIRSGKIKTHVMPDFPGKPFEDPNGVEDWLQFYDMSAPIVCLSVLHSGNDTGLNLRMEHTHCFGVDGADENQKGGHYHFDLDETKDVVEYEGWFNVAEVLYRIDPTNA
ncbi:hypothetical protein N0V93_000525 [Gnomoniopsis smithogilvyi]|uniref:DUF1907 domain-containing protein n=1 Tax=Gnomoniopsis smithogilvyi TaxID=1191159 RepID=A0A9W9D1U2_9PEZI|nr:hypothetical protein N0V93_000525 [Gnomoniopsis smithogilvyi]